MMASYSKNLPYEDAPVLEKLNPKRPSFIKIIIREHP